MKIRVGLKHNGRQKTPGDLHLYKSTTQTRSLLFLWLGTISHLAKITPQWLWQNYPRVCHILIGLHEDKILRAYDLQQADKLEVDDRTKF